MRALSHGLAVLVALVLCWPLLPLRIDAAQGDWLVAGRELLLLGLPAFLVYLGMRAHLRKDHADGVWATEAGSLGWLLASPLATALPIAGADRTLLSGAALLYGAHLLVITGHRRSRPVYLAGAGAALAGALLAQAPLAPLVVIVALHGLFGGYRHLSRPRFNALSGRAVAGLAGFALPLIGAGLLRDDPIVPPLPLLEPDLARLLAALGGPRGLLIGAPWVLLALGGLGLWWRRGTRRDFLWVTLGILSASLAATLLPPAALAPGREPLLVAALLPFLAGPTARFLSHLRDRPGRRGPRLAGLALGLVLAGALGASGLGEGVELLRSAEAITPGLDAGWMLRHLPPLAATTVACALLALLLPGRASARGRAEAAALATLGGLLLAGGLHLLAGL